MPKFVEHLKAQGLTDEEIKQISDTLGTNPKAVAAFDGMIDQSAQKLAEAERKAAEAKEAEVRLNKFWADEATPQINEAYSKVAAAEARAKFYEEQAKSAKESGFIPADAPAAPVVTPNANPVPGSPAIDPKYMTKEDAWMALSNAQWALTEYMRLNSGQPLPDDIDSLVKEATSARQPFRQYVEKKYEFEAKRQAAAAAAQKAHDDKIRAEEREVVTREITEKSGSNPFTRTGQTSRFSKFEKAGDTADKLAWARPDAKEKLRARAHELVAKEQIQ